MEVVSSLHCQCAVWVTDDTRHYVSHGSGVRGGIYMIFTCSRAGAARTDPRG